MYRSQFMPQADNVGTTRFYPEAGYMINGPDASEWLRTGMAKTITGYPTAATLEHLKVSGLVSGTFTSASFISIATDGAGVFVAVPSGGASLYVSNNGGATWSTAVHNMVGGQAVTSVAFGGDKFVVTGNSASQFCYSYILAATALSNPATAWTGAGTTSIGGGGATASTAKISYGGGKFVAVCINGSVTGSAAYSTTGTSFTASNLSQVLTTNLHLIYGGGKWLVGSTNNASNANVSTDGITWSNASTLPAAIAGSLSYGAGVFLLNSLYTSTDAVTWTNRGTTLGFSGYTTTTGSQNATYFDGTRFITGCQNVPAIWWSLDGINWKLRWLASTPNTSHIVCGDGSRLLVMSTAASTTALYSTSFTTPDYIGTGKTVFAAGASSATTNNESAIGYVRIK